jgi:hypothetical protein
MLLRRDALVGTFLLVVPLVVGCSPALSGEGEGEEDLAESQQAVESSNRMSLNRMSLNRMSLNGLSAATLSPDGQSLTGTSLISTEEGRELLRYVVRCALPPGETLTASYSGVVYQFQGAIGLAPDWLSSPLSLSGQRWMTACLLAHANGYGMEVPISMRGFHPALQVTEEEVNTFTVEEATYYGNLFITGGSNVVTAYQGDDDDDDSGGATTTYDAGAAMFACAGNTLSSQCGSSAETFRPQRSCGSNSLCALSFVGKCATSPVSSPHACKYRLWGLNAYCHGELSGSNGQWPTGSTAHVEAITVYLRPESWSQLYLGCNSL